MKKLLLLTLLLSSFILFGSDDDHRMSKITGEKIELSTKGHSFAGRIDNKLIFGDVSTDGHQTSNIILKTDKELIKAEFKNNEGSWGGTIKSEEKTLDIKFVELIKEIPAFVIEANGTKYTVRIESEDFQNNHFIKPSYILQKQDGSEIKVKMQEGQACYMYSLHLIFMIFGSYLF